MSPHPVEEFWSILRDYQEYPPDVVPVPELLPGTAAFAASAGLYRQRGSRELPPFPFGGLMIIGHNLDSREGYEQRRSLGISHGDVVPQVPLMGTWSGLYKLLRLGGVPVRNFFFTNVLVGLKEGRPTGRFTAHPMPEYRRWCNDFLGHQVLTMKPRVVLVLGGPASRDIAEASAPRPWQRRRLPPPRPVLARLHGHETILVPAHHPSMQKRIAADAESLRQAWDPERR